MILICSLWVMSNHVVLKVMVEDCANAIDDDGDGKIDLNDPDCDCMTEEPQSLIPNPSFEEQNCCPFGRSQLNCAKDWIQASQPTTDYIHTCGFLGWEGIPAPLPYPDGDGIVGFRDGRALNGNREPNWKEYAGACLLSPLEKGVSYTFEFYLGFVNQRISPPIDITFFGSSSCDNLPFGQQDQFLGCPTNEYNGGWKYLNSKKVSGQHWQLTSLTITPSEDIHAIAIGPPCALTTSSENLYYFFDNLILAQTQFFRKTIFESQNPCTENFRLEIEPSEQATYQWYRDGIALVGETKPFYEPNLVSGDYSVMEYKEGQCILSKPSFYRVPVEFSTIKKTICEDEVYEFGAAELTSTGIYTDTFKNATFCDSIVRLELEVIGESSDSVQARILKGDAFNIESFTYTEPGAYDLTLISSHGCDSLIHLDLSHYKVFIPNVFSPNDDGINDRFELFIEEVDVHVVYIKIFDRWGNMVYRFSELESEGLFFWDGKINNEQPKIDIYTYVIELNLENKKNRIITGDVAVVL